MNWTVHTTMSCGVLGLALAAMPAMAAPPDAHPFLGHTELSDAALDRERGRFISADQILFFGVDMYTEWRTAMGDVYAAAMNIGIDRTGAAPTVSVSSNVQTSSTGGNGAGSAASSQLGSGGMDQVTGVSQLTQVTGNGNGVANRIGIDIGTQRPVSTVSSDPALAGANKTLVDAQSGAVAQTFADRNRVGVSIAVPNQGTASQSIASMIGMQQRAQVFGDANIIQNRLNLMIQVQTNGSLNAARMSNLLQSMRGLGQAGLN